MIKKAPTQKINTLQKGLACPPKTRDPITTRTPETEIAVPTIFVFSTIPLLEHG